MQKIICRKVSPGETELMEKIYRLRYHVYVHERRFLSASDYPNGLEQDPFDANSIHFAALTPSGEVLGTLRLILSEHTPTQIDQYDEELNIHPEHLLFPFGELSRFCIGKKHIGKLLPDHIYLQNYLNPITLSFYNLIAKECAQRNIETLFALIEKPLAVMLKRSGLKLQCVGEEINMYGRVRPYKLRTNDDHNPVVTFELTDDDRVLV